MRHRSCLAAWLGILGLAAASGLAAQTGNELDFFVGEWDITVVDTLERTIGKARTEARFILDGTAIQDDYLGLDPAGNVNFRGTSIRTFVPATGRWVVHWAMANTPGYTYIDARWTDGELLGDGRGFDAGGEFVEKYRYYDITPARYSFSLSRSYDGGSTWVAYPELRARKKQNTTGGDPVGSPPVLLP